MSFDIKSTRQSFENACRTNCVLKAKPGKLDIKRREPGILLINLHIVSLFKLAVIPGRVAQSITCLATDACLTADPGVASSIPARYHTFVEIDH